MCLRAMLEFFISLANISLSGIWRLMGLFVYRLSECCRWRGGGVSNDGWIGGVDIEIDMLAVEYMGCWYVMLFQFFTLGCAV
jgi:hypothetical protein